MTQGQFFNGVKLALLQTFSLCKNPCLTKTKMYGLTFYLIIARGRTNGVILFPKALARCETQSSPLFELKSRIPISVMITTSSCVLPWYSTKHIHHAFYHGVA